MAISDKEKMLTSAQKLIEYALRIGALELVPKGRKLKSGRISPFFFNSGLFNTGESIDRLAHAYANTLITQFGNEGEVIFGPAYKGIPLSIAIAMKLATLGDTIGYAFNRKEAKDHGEGGLIVGMPLAGRRVIIVDDVITTGESKREAVEIICAQGGTPIGCIIAFDRQEKGYDQANKADMLISAAQEFEQMFNIPLVAAATLADLISVLEMTSNHDDNTRESLEMILAYRQQYGV